MSEAGIGQRDFAHGRRFTLVTIARPGLVDDHPYRDVLRHYHHFGSLFRTVDIRDYSRADNDADVTILDRFALTAAHVLADIPIGELVARLAGTRNLVLLTSDLHHWSLFPHLSTELVQRPRLTPADNRVEPICDFLKRLGIRHLISNYDCPELRQVRAQLPGLDAYVVELHVDTGVFRDRRLRKKYDVIIYGGTGAQCYPFRHRVSRLLIESGRFRILQIKPGAMRFDPEVWGLRLARWLDRRAARRQSEPEPPLYDPRVSGEGLARKINRSWLALATVSDFDYLVGRYFEIPAAGSVVLGNMNAQGQAIYNGRYVHIDDGMTDAQILDTVGAALADRKRLRGLAAEMHELMHARFGLGQLEQRLHDIAAEIAGAGDG